MPYGTLTVVPYETRRSSMRLFVMLFAGLLVLTGPSNAATVSITCHLFAGGPPSNVPSTDNLPLMYVLTLDYLPFAIDD